MIYISETKFGRFAGFPTSPNRTRWAKRDTLPSITQYVDHTEFLDKNCYFPAFRRIGTSRSRGLAENYCNPGVGLASWGKIGNVSSFFLHAIQILAIIVRETAVDGQPQLRVSQRTARLIHDVRSRRRPGKAVSESQANAGRVEATICQTKHTLRIVIVGQSPSVVTLNVARSTAPRIAAMLILAKESRGNYEQGRKKKNVQRQVQGS